MDTEELIDSIEDIAAKAQSPDYDPYLAVIDLMRIVDLIIEYRHQFIDKH